MEISGHFPSSHPPVGLPPPPFIFNNTDRETAETLLLNQYRGTYLFRKGEEDKQLEKTLLAPCHTLTWLGEDEKISEKVVVQTRKGYLFYDDDLSLSGKAFSTLSALLSTLEPPLTKQLIP